MLSDLSLTISFTLFSFLQCETKMVLSCLPFSHIFEVKAKYDANNLAYTTNFLPLHIDLPYYDYIPGVSDGLLSFFSIKTENWMVKQIKVYSTPARLETPW